VVSVVVFFYLRKKEKGKAGFKGHAAMTAV